MQEVYREAKNKKKKQYTVILAMLFGFLMIGLLTILLDFLFSFSAILLFPFLILPYFIAMQMTLIQIDVQEFNRRRFYRMFAIGLSPLVRKSFSALKNVLIAVIIYYLTSQASMIIFGLFPKYSEVIKQLNESVANSGNILNISNTINDAIQNNELLKNMIFISSSIAYGLAFMFFVYKMLHNALYALCKTSASLPNGKKRPVFNEVFKKYSKQYYKTYYKKEWYKVALVPIFYAGGILLAYFLDLPGLNLLFGVTLAFIAIVILLPNLMLYQEKTYVKMFEELSKRNITNMQKVYSDLKDQANLTKEQEAALEDFMKQLENAVKDKEEQNKNDENKNSDE